MRRILALFLVMLMVFTIFSLAFAQSLTDPSTWSQYWANVGALSGLVLIGVQFLKLHILAKVLATKWHVIALSIILGIILGLVGLAVHFYQGTPVSAILFGLQAGIIASGFKDVLGSLTGQKALPAASSEPHLDPGTGILPR